jgi:MYXO-CTERM domain-containing protein
MNCRHFRTIAIAAMCIATSPPGAMAQTMNIDINQNGGIPSNLYGGVLNQPGHWNSIDGAVVGHNQGVTDLGNNWFGTTWTNDTGNNFLLFDDPGTSGDVEALMDDGFELGGPGSLDTFSLHILQNGIYNVAVYAWTPGTAPFSTSVSVNGLPSQNLSGLWPGGHQLGVTYALFENVSVNNFTMTIDTTVLSGVGTLNGLQLQMVPAPPAAGALALLGLAGLGGTRRRRQ